MHKSVLPGDQAQPERMPSARIAVALALLPSVFQVRMVLPAVASQVPSGEIATAFTAPSQPPRPTDADARYAGAVIGGQRREVRRITAR